jgi:hypothetical protein
MENRLHHLNKIIDNEMSKTPVFTEKDEQNVLAAIKRTPPTRMANKKKTVVPKLLTAALFAGIIFTSYTVIDNYLTPDSATKEKKPETRYAEEFTQASSKITYDVSTRELTIEGTVKNTTNFNSEPFQARVNILKNDLSTDLGTNSFNLDVPSNNVLSPDEPYSFEKVINLDLGIVDENTFKDAIQVEIFSKTKTLTSFVIDNITYEDAHVDDPKESEQPADQQPPAPEEPKLSTENNETDQKEMNQENQTTKESLAELEKKYGKKRTPFTTIDVVSKGTNFYINGITLGKSLEQILQILGPYDDYSDTGYHSPITGAWNIKSTLSDSYLEMEFNKPGKEGNVTSIRYRTSDRAFVEKWVTYLGKPFSEKPNVKFFYKEDSQQMLIVLNLDNYYEVILQYETNLEIYQ